MQAYVLLKEPSCWIPNSPALTRCRISFCVSGWLVDETKDYSAAFYLSGLCLVSSALFLVLVDRLLQRRKAEEAEFHRAAGHAEDGVNVR